MYNTCYFLTKGRLRVSSETIRYETDDGKKIDVPIKSIEDIYLNAYSQYTSDALLLLSRNRVSIHFFNNYEYYIGTFIPKDHVSSGRTLILEVDHYYNLEKRLYIAKEILIGAFKNIKRNIAYYNTRNNDEKMMNTSSYLNKLKSSETVNALMIVEAKYRKEYYSYYENILGIKEFKRVCPNSEDIINSLISFLNSMLYSVIYSEIMKTHISGEIGFLHETGDNRYPLIYDISEIFKPLIVDRVIFRMINRKQLDESDIIDGKFCDDAIKTIFREWNNQLNETIYHRTLKRHISYRNLIREEIYKLERHLKGIKLYKSFVLWW